MNEYLNMDNSLIDVFLVLWFILSSLFICFWIIGNHKKKKSGKKFSYAPLILMAIVIVSFGLFLLYISAYSDSSIVMTLGIFFVSLGMSSLSFTFSEMGQVKNMSEIRIKLNNLQSTQDKILQELNRK
jgi:uncharacterized membrane protein HdeD (DUF308 family)